MNPSHNDFVSHPARREADGPGEDTLRLIASLPAPPGLADRMRAGLRTAPQAGRILMARGPVRPPFGWMNSTLVRVAAAAAIVGVVAGGGWRIYSHVQPAGTAQRIVMPGPVSSTGKGFSNAGASRVPETLQGPVLSHPVVAAPEVNVVEKAPTPPKPAIKKTKQAPRNAPLHVQ
jgi:hypothetical protein